MIVTFGNRATSDLFHGISTSRVRRLPIQIIDSALYKLDILNSAHASKDLQSPPGNRLEALRGDYAGFHSIRITNQWRIIFQWQDGNVHDVQIIDYHK
jgi:proteic killer suppression protein